MIKAVSLVQSTVQHEQNALKLTCLHLAILAQSPSVMTTPIPPRTSLLEILTMGLKKEEQKNLFSLLFLHSYQYTLKNMVQFNALAPLFSRVVKTI